MINDYPISAVDAPTGTGKTRFVTQYMATKGYKVRVVIPTTVAVRDTYRFQQEHTNLKVGYAAGREIHYSDNDTLVYATTGHFTQRILGLIKSNRKDQVRVILGDILFIDEVHVATSYMTLLIGLIRYLYKVDNKYTGPRIVFLTATFNHGDIMDHFENFPVYQVTMENKLIEDIFLPTPRDIIRDDPNSEIEKIVRKEMTRWLSSPKKYHGIIFRPGLNEVEDMIDYLESRFISNEPIEFYPAYGNLSPNELDEIFQKSDKMKVVVGTNIIESSVTIEDVGFIVNDMLEKVAETSATGGDKLILAVISQASSKQRRGRTGRTVEGRNYMLITKDEYTKLELFRKREIDRIPIYDIVLQLIDAGLDPRDILKISVNRYEQARRVLLNFGMIENKADRYFVTETGRFVSSISLSVQNAYMIYLGYQRFHEKYRANVDISAEKILLRSVIATACMLEAFGPPYFYVPRRTRAESVGEYQARRDSHVERYHEKFRGATDIHTLVNIFWEMMSDIDVARKYDQATQGKISHYVKEWTTNNSMNNKKIKEFMLIMRDVESLIESKIKENTPLRSELPQNSIDRMLPLSNQTPYQSFTLGQDVPSGAFGVLGDNIAGTFAQAYIANLFTRGVDDRRRITYNDPRTGIQYKINRNNSFNKIEISELTGPGVIIAAQTIEVVGKGGGKINLAGLIISDQYFPANLQSRV